MRTVKDVRHAIRTEETKIEWELSRSNTGLLGLFGYVRGIKFFTSRGLKGIMTTFEFDDKYKNREHDYYSFRKGRAKHMQSWYNNFLLDLAEKGELK